MAYDIPDEIKYKEKIVANLDSKQLLYAIAFGVLALITYNLPLEGDLRMVLPGTSIIIGIGFVFLKVEEKVLDVFAYYSNIRKAQNNSKRAQKFFEIKEIKDDCVYLENGKIISILEVYPINFELLEESRKKILLNNYSSFLNQLQNPIQILVRTKNVELKDYFETLEKNKFRKDLVLKLYSDFRVFQENFLDEKSIKERKYYLIIPIQKTGKNDLKLLNEKIEILTEKLRNCGLESKRLSSKELLEFYFSYADVSNEENKSKLNKKDESIDGFRNIITPSFDIRKDYALVNGELHRIIKVAGYPRKVENGWLQAFLSKNENYDISLHVTPSSINYMLVYLHNQIIQQTSDLIMSTTKGTPNPSLEIKKADTMRVYDSLYKGEQKMFSVSVYIDKKSDSLENLDMLTEKCKSNLNSYLMIPKNAEWRMADGIKSTLPLGENKLNSNRDFLTDSLTATFPFISAVDTKKEGLLFAHELETLNPIFVDLDKMSNKHFFVIGISGSGKSYTSKYLIIQQLFKEDSKIYILDPNGEYSKLCKSLGGQLIKLSRNSESIINVFDLAGEDFGDKMLSLVSAFDIIVGGLTESQKAVLSKALVKTYARKGIFYNKPETWKRKPPTFSDFNKTLMEMRREYSKEKHYVQDASFEVLINRVQMYSKKGIFGFLDKQSKIDFENKFVCFDLSELPLAVKNLMMFSTLELINREIKKDKDAKVVLIDEGWALLRSKESSNYILDFVKTSRKFNASLGFITQEIEDLLRSKTGKSILNTASMKVLMRQNPSNIDLISKNLNLNEKAENYLMTAPKGSGLLITDSNTYKFVVHAPEKIHYLITTDPMEIEEEKKPEKKIIEFKLNRGIYLKNKLNEDQVAYLMSKGYLLYKGRLSRRGGSSYYLVKVRHNENTDHAFLCWQTYYLLKKKYKNAKLSTTDKGDVSVEVNDKKIAFEIETGENMLRDTDEKVNKKFQSVKDSFDDYYIVVTDWLEKRKYEGLGKVITRSELKKTIDSLDT